MMELVVHDEYILDDVKNFFSTSFLGLSDLTQQYINIMTNVRENGFKSGKTADALETFISQVSMETTDENISADVVSPCVSRYCDHFIDRIDDADQKLYD